MMKTVKLIFGLSLALLYSAVIFAEPVGILTMKAGTLKLRRNNIDTIYTDPGVRIPIENRDEVQTGSGTRAEIRMAAQGDLVELFPNTFMMVDNVTSEKTHLSMLAGKGQFEIKKTGKLTRKKRGRFRLRTVNAVIGVKGTKIIVGVMNGRTDLMTLSGIASLASRLTPDLEIEVKPNQVSKIPGNRQPFRPVTVTPEVRQRIIESDSAESFEQVPFADEPEKEDAGQKQRTKKGAEEADVEAGQDVDTLIEQVNDDVEQAQEDIDDTQTNKHSIEFTIVDE
jgi:FecR protein